MGGSQEQGNENTGDGPPYPAWGCRERTTQPGLADVKLSGKRLSDTSHPGRPCPVPSRGPARFAPLPRVLVLSWVHGLNKGGALGGGPPFFIFCGWWVFGGVLLSHTLAGAVPSALEGLASGFGMGPGVSPPLWPPFRVWSCVAGWVLSFSGRAPGAAQWTRVVSVVASPRPISTGQLHTLRCFHFRPINPVVWLGALTHDGVGDLILERASRLDAFSGYPFRTWLTSRAPGGTTGTPEVRPSRSSRTRDSLPQVSCARGG